MSGLTVGVFVGFFKRRSGTPTVCCGAGAASFPCVECLNNYHTRLGNPGKRCTSLPYSVPGTYKLIRDHIITQLACPQLSFHITSTPHNLPEPAEWTTPVLVYMQNNPFRMQPSEICSRDILGTPFGTFKKMLMFVNIRPCFGKCQWMII